MIRRRRSARLLLAHLALLLAACGGGDDDPTGLGRNPGGGEIHPPPEITEGRATG